MFQKFIRTDNQRATIWIRLMVGVVFLPEGIQKFLFADKLGAGRSAKTGLPAPDFSGSFVGSFETICGILILLGLLTRLAALPLIRILVVAMATTKADILAAEGFGSMMHGSRTDWSMFLGSIFLFIKGGGKWPVNYRMQAR